MSLFSKDQVKSYFNTDYYNALETQTRLEGQQMEEEVIANYDKKVAQVSSKSKRNMIIIFSLAALSLATLVVLKKKGVI